MIDPKLLRFEDCVTLDSGRTAIVHEAAFQHPSGRWDVWVWVWGTKLERVSLNKIVSAERGGQRIWPKNIT